MEPIEIKYNRIRIAALLLLCLAFTYLGWNFVSDPGHYTSHRYKSSGFIFLAGLICFISFGLGNLVLLKMLFRKNPALIINEKGITDYSSFISIGLIHWEDIIYIKAGKVKSTQFITIHVKNKKKYLSLSKNRFQNYMMKLNSKYYHSPIHINTSALRGKHDELSNTIHKAFDVYKNNNPV